MTDKEMFQDVAECFGVVLAETLRWAIFTASHPRADSHESRRASDTGNLREGWRNLAGKCYDYYEVGT